MYSSEITDEQISYLNSLKNVLTYAINTINVSSSIRQINAEGHQSKWTNTFSKLKIFDLTDFQKIVFVDSDMLVLKNIDELFQMENMSAVVADGSYPGNNYTGLNSGLLVCVPQKGESERLIGFLPSDSKRLLGDQDIFKLGYPNWEKNTALHIPEEYNVFIGHADYYQRKQGLDIKVAHFVGETKPWNFTFGQKIGKLLRRVLMRKMVSLKIESQYYSIIKQEKLKYHKWSSANKKRPDHLVKR